MAVVAVVVAERTHVATAHGPAGFAETQCSIALVDAVIRGHEICVGACGDGDGYGNVPMS